MRVLMLMLACFMCIVSDAQQLSVSIEGIRSKSGVIRLAVFRNQQEFENEHAFKSVVSQKNELYNGQMKLVFQLPAGIYGICVLDDEDNSGNMSYKLKVFPTEGVGFSNYSLQKLSKPKFSDFSFNLQSSKTLVIRIHYF